ncbi:unnamed protein product, partial [Vitis vinifera]|uniref:Uncharacterized protein n=1 Tax=Vitis vinifera TaxID=29760 RepID=D7TQM7_VITVI
MVFHKRTFKKAKSLSQGRKIHVESYTPSPLTCHNSPTTFSSSLSPSLSLLSSSFSVSCAHLIIKDSEYRYGGLGRSEDGVRSGNITSCNTGILDHGHCLLPAG